MMPPSRLRRSFAFLCRELIGLAQDFWKDGRMEPVKPPPTPATSRKKEKTPGGIWHAEPGEVAEKMWGHGSVVAGDDYIRDLMIPPLGLNKGMHVLDLSAGLGEKLRKMAEKFDISIDGFEADPQIAARGAAILGKAKQVSIADYDPATLALKNKYDCVIGREILYRVEDKAKFVSTLVANCKPKAQVSFTDYIVNPEMRDQQGITTWRASEKGANPASLVEMAEIWAKAGMSLRVHDDLTLYYRREIRAGLIRLTEFLTSGVVADAATQSVIKRSLMSWALRMGAFSQGMKFYRFYGERS